MATAGETTLQWVDYLVVVAYIVFTLLVGYISSRGTKNSLKGYFLASKNMHWIPIGASIYSSDVGSTALVGYAGAGAASGLAASSFNLNAVYVLMLLGWVFLPVYLSSGVYTMPEYLRLRFGGQRIRVYCAVISLLLIILSRMSGNLYAGALFIQKAVGDSSVEMLYASILALLAVSGILALLGGLTVVIWTDAAQTVLVIIGTCVLMVVSLVKVGGWNKMKEDYFYAMPEKLAYDSNNKTCGLPNPNAFSILRPMDDPLPWPGMTIGALIMSIWYWCSDQVIIQRVLTSRNMTHAKAGIAFSAYLKILNLFLMVFPGMAARILFPNEVACVDPVECKRICGNASGCSNIAFVTLVLELLPIGLRGCMLAVMLAALVSSLTSIFNSASAIFTIDVWAVLRSKAWQGKSPRAVELEQLIVGRIAICVLIVLSVLWVPILRQTSDSLLIVYLQGILSFLTPPMAAITLLAVLWSRINEPGVFWALMCGLVLGILRMVAQFSYTVPPCGSAEPDLRPQLVKTLVGGVNSLHFGIFLFLFTICVAVAVSYLHPPTPKEMLHRMTFRTRFSRQPREQLDNKSNDEPGKNMQAQSDKADEEPSRVLATLCCMTDKSKSSGEPQLSHGQQMDNLMEYMKESPRDKMLVNALMVGAASAVTFVYGYYA